MDTFLNTPIYEEMIPFLNKGQNNHKVIKAIVYGEGGPFIAFKVMSTNRYRDYENSVADIYKVVLKVGMGDFVYKVHPARSNIEIVMHTKIGNGDTKQERFLAFIDTKNTPSVTGSQYMGMDADVLNQSGFVDVEFDLWPPSVFEIKNKRTKGAYRNMSVSSMMEEVFDKEVAKTTDIKSFIMEPADNDIIRSNMVLYDGVHITSVPTFTQFQLGGIYSEGIGTYLQRYKDTLSMFIYPLYKLDRFTDSSDRLVFILANNNHNTQLENTYDTQGGTTKILITGPVSYKDHGDNELENTGSGYRRASAGAMMSKPVSIHGKDVKGISFDLAKRELVDNSSTRVFNTPNASRPISDNPYLERSKLAFKRAAMMFLTWNNSNDDVVFPGAPCRVITQVNGRVTTTDGVVVSSETNVSLNGSVGASELYSSTTFLKVMVTKDEKSHTLANQSERPAVQSTIL